MEMQFGAGIALLIDNPSNNYKYIILIVVNTSSTKNLL